MLARILGMEQHGKLALLKMTFKYRLIGALGSWEFTINIVSLVHIRREIHFSWPMDCAYVKFALDKNGATIIGSLLRLWIYNQ